MKSFWVMMLLFPFLLAGCTAKQPTSSTADTSTEQQTQADNETVKADSFMQISQETAREMMEMDDGHVVVDVRRQDEYDAGHIPGAILIPNESIDTQPPEELPDLNQIILIYCRSGNRSKQAAQKLFDMGYTRIYEFGGINTWTGDIVTEQEEEDKPAGNDFAEVEIEDSLDSEMETVDLSENIEMPVQVSYAGEEPLEYRDLDYDTVILEESDYQVQIVFTAEQNVHDFHIYRLSFNDVDSEGNPVFETEQIYAQEELSRERPLQAVLTFPGDMPTVGFSYVRQDGQECRFSIGQSGKDGSLITSPF